MLACGDTFYADDELTDDGEPHLWIIVTPPTDGEVVTVSITTRRKRSETTVVLQSGEHPFIRHESVIAYSFSRIRLVEEIERAIANGTARKREPVSEKLLQRAKNGLADSDFTPNGVRHYYKSIVDAG